MLLSLALFAACHLPAEAPMARTGAVEYAPLQPEWITPEVTPERPTEIRLTWAGLRGADYYVEFGYDTTYGTLAPAEPDGSAVLLGLKADTDVHARILTVIDGAIHASDDFVVHTEALPRGLPTVTLDVAASDDLAAGFVLLTTFDPTTRNSVVLVVDRDGDPVWWELVTGVAVRSGHQSQDGLGLHYRCDDPVESEDAGVVVTRWDRTGGRVVVSAEGHHDLVELPDGTLALIEEDVREWEGVPVVGDRIVEVDADGLRRTVWSSWDWKAPERTEAWDTMYNERGEDWTHANGIDHDPVSDTYLLSMYSLATVVRVDRASGDTLWELGGEGSDFSLGEDAGFAPQHAPVFGEDGLWLFDNHTAELDVETASRVVRYELDEATAEAEVVWQWTDPDETLSTPILGDVRPLEGGSVFVSFGAVPRAVVVAPDGEIQWQVGLDRGLMLGRGDAFESFYGPDPIVLP